MAVTLGVAWFGLVWFKWGEIFKFEKIQTRTRDFFFNFNFSI
jgi:hypothetical protein